MFCLILLIVAENIIPTFTNNAVHEWLIQCWFKNLLAEISVLETRSNVDKSHQSRMKIFKAVLKNDLKTYARKLLINFQCIDWKNFNLFKSGKIKEKSLIKESELNWTKNKNINHMEAYTNHNNIKLIWICLITYNEKWIFIISIKDLNNDGMWWINWNINWNCILSFL